MTDVSWEQPFQEALEIINRGGFEEVKNALEKLGFTLRQTGDPNHWIYFHVQLREDPIFRYPRNLYRPHGTRRSSDRISRRDQSQAKQMVEALRVTISALQNEGENQ